MARPRKAWGELSPGYRDRMRRNGLTARNWATPKGAELRAQARGHARTPEHPSQAAKQPQRYGDYIQRASDEMRQLQARKEAVFGTAIRYKASRSERNAMEPPASGKANRRLVRKFLRMTSDQAYEQASAFATSIKGKNKEEVLEIIQTDWSGDDWSFLFYH